MTTKRELISKIGALADQVGDTDQIMWHRNEPNYPWVRNREAQAALRDLLDTYADYQTRPSLASRLATRVQKLNPWKRAAAP
jgi:hypothetical protein